jgi:hypothetical protein
MQGGLDALRHVVGRRVRLDRQGVGDALHTSEIAHGTLRCVALELPVHLSFQRDPAILDLRLHIVGDLDVPRQCVHDLMRDLGIGTAEQVRQLHGQILRDGANTGHAFRGLRRCPALHVVGNAAGERDDAIPHRDPDLAFIEPWLPLELRGHVLLQIQVGLHECLRACPVEAWSHAQLWRAPATVGDVSRRAGYLAAIVSAVRRCRTTGSDDDVAPHVERREADVRRTRIVPHRQAREIGP